MESQETGPCSCGHGGLLLWGTGRKKEFCRVCSSASLHHSPVRPGSFSVMRTSNLMGQGGGEGTKLGSPRTSVNRGFIWFCSFLLSCAFR